MAPGSGKTGREKAFEGILVSYFDFRPHFEVGEKSFGFELACTISFNKIVDDIPQISRSYSPCQL